jgi:hypothetical protein
LGLRARPPYNQQLETESEKLVLLKRYLKRWKRDIIISARAARIL